MIKGMQGMRKNVNVYTDYGFLTTSKPRLLSLRIALSTNVGMCGHVCTYIPTPRISTTCAMIECDIDPIRLVYQVLWLLYGSCSRYRLWVWP